MKDQQVTCRKCGHGEIYARTELFLAPPIPSNQNQRSDAGILAVIAGMVAGVRLARVESGEIQTSSPRVRDAVADAVALAEQVMEKVKRSPKTK